MLEYIEKTEMLNLDANIRKKAPISICDLSDGLMLKVILSLFKRSLTQFTNKGICLILVVANDI